MEFGPNGEYKNRHISNDEEYVLLDGKEESCTWKYSKTDSILDICQYKFKVLKYGSDTIHLLEMKNNFKALFINNIQ